jgi:hypothetical protein
MTPDMVVEIGKRALEVTLLLGAPMLLFSLVVGVELARSVARNTGPGRTVRDQSGVAGRGAAPPTPHSPTPWRGGPPGSARRAAPSSISTAPRLACRPVQRLKEDEP